MQEHLNVVQSANLLINTCAAGLPSDQYTMRLAQQHAAAQDQLAAAAAAQQSGLTGLHAQQQQARFAAQVSLEALLRSLSLSSGHAQQLWIGLSNWGIALICWSLTGLLLLFISNISHCVQAAQMAAEGAPQMGVSRQSLDSAFGSAQRALQLSTLSMPERITYMQVRMYK